MIINNLTLKNTMLGSILPKLAQFNIPLDDEGYLILGGYDVDANYLNIDDDMWLNIKRELTEGIKVKYTNGNTVYISIEQWKTANVVNFSNVSTVRTNNPTSRGCFILHYENSGNNITGSDYTAISMFSNAYSGPATWNLGHLTYNLTLSGNTSVSYVGVK